jgi:ornithine cyclodeaminase/alanine dehydrogenase-like protein (mu-crystallin family)
MVREASELAIEQGEEGEKGLLEWLETGNIIYKSVGLGLMDLVTGGDLVQLARERGVGTTIQDF